MFTVSRIKKGALQARSAPSGADECGCTTAALFLAGALPLSIAWQALNWNQLNLTWGRACWRVLIVCVCAGLVGKVVGLIWLGIRRSRRNAPRTLSHR
jgi:hypothetical protein